MYAHEIGLNLARAGWKISLKRRFYRGLWFVISPALTRLGPISGVVLTCTRNDGGGAQWLARISVIAFANRFGFRYQHSEIYELMPVGSNEIRKTWNNLITGTFEGQLLRPVRVRVISLKQLILLSIRGCLCRRQVLVDIGHLHVYTDWFPSSIENARLDKNLIYTNPAGIGEVAATGLSFAAVHVRRGLEWEWEFGANRVTSNSEVLRRITLLVESRGPMTGTVYSGLPNPELEALLPEGFELNSTANEFEVIHRMINADFVILAKSSMSYIAGVFARGEVIYEPFWHPALSNWTKI